MLGGIKWYRKRRETKLEGKKGKRNSTCRQMGVKMKGHGRWTQVRTSEGLRTIINKICVHGSVRKGEGDQEWYED